MTSVRVLSRHMFLIRAELGFLGELDDAFLVLLPGIPFAHGCEGQTWDPQGQYQTARSSLAGA